jgi:hypothetical protein
MALPEPNGDGDGDGTAVTVAVDVDADIRDTADVPDIADVFLEQSYLTYIVPSTTKFDPKEVLQDGGSIESNISSIEQRDQLFFGTRFANCSCSSVALCSCANCR